jgi:hypothetical protein
MHWTKEQLAEALECIDAIKKAMSATQRTIDSMLADLKEMREAADRMNGQMTCADAPSICPN